MNFGLGISVINDYVMCDFEILLFWFGVIEVGNIGFRFVKIELLDFSRNLKLKEVRVIFI